MADTTTGKDGISKGRLRLGDLPALLASLPHLEPEDAEAFAADLEEARRQANEVPLADPWER